MKQIFPEHIVKNSADVHRFQHTVSSMVIYSMVLLSMIGTLIALPFMFFDIYSSAQGIIKTEEENNLITSLYTGKVNSIYIKENQAVQKGDTLLVLDNIVGQQKMNLLSNQMEQVHTFVYDLNYLANTSELTQDSLRSVLYQKQLIQYTQKLQELEARLFKNKSDFKRQKKLYIRNVIARVEYENSKYKVALAVGELNHYKKQQRNHWQTELIEQANKLKQLQTTYLQLKEQRDDLTIVASISGTIQNLIGLEVGNFLTASTPIAEISPDTELIAECYIDPSDIGLLSPMTTVKLQVNAFNHNQWGTVTGKVISIHEDISFVNNAPMFKVICSLDQKYLQLKNGHKGALKKGMTLNARFFIANRSAFDLLYDKIDHWFNPSITAAK